MTTKGLHMPLATSLLYRIYEKILTCDSVVYIETKGFFDVYFNHTNVFRVLYHCTSFMGGAHSLHRYALRHLLAS